jgi:NADH-ubiquinone oxidoreductase chain 2
MPKISIIIFLLELESDISLNIDSLASSESIFFSSGSLIGLNGYTTINIVKNLLLISSLLSLVIGTVLGLAQYKIKRLLAYSTISHVGFLLLALAVNTEQSIESLIFYLLQYSITNLNAFLILLAFGYIINSSYNSNNTKSGAITTFNGKMDSSYSDIKLISDLKGQFYSNPLLSLSFAVCLLSMAGIPPLMGFFAKQQVLYSASHSGYFFLSIVAILVSVISAYYYLQIIKVTHFDSDSKALSEGSKENLSVVSQGNRLEFTNIHSMTISTLTLTIILFIINPSILLNSTHLMALSIFTN